MQFYKNGFPEEFLWGASISAFQAEGAYEEDAKGLTTADVRSFRKADKIADTKIAMDFYHHWEKDVELLREMGAKAFRFSISWARIFPNGNDNAPNEKGIAFYDRLIDRLVEYGIEPVVTMYHFDLPYGLVKQYNGWVSRQSICDFERYAKTLFERFGGRVKFWLTINEQNILAVNPALMGIEEKDMSKAFALCAKGYYHMFLANAKAVQLCHRMLPDAKIGPAVSYPTIFSMTPRSEDQLAADNAWKYMAQSALDIYIHGYYPKYYLTMLERKHMAPEFQEGDKELLAGAKPDYVGLNWYVSMAGRAPETVVHAELKDVDKGQSSYEEMTGVMPFAFEMCDNPYTEYNEWHWNYDPAAFRYALRKFEDMYHMPCLITENGCGHRDVVENGSIHDEYRIQYLRQHIEQMEAAVREDGVQLFGYCPWSFLDVLSSSDGVEKRYGLVYVNRDDFDSRDLKRIKKDSYYWYKEKLANV